MPPFFLRRLADDDACTAMPADYCCAMRGLALAAVFVLAVFAIAPQAAAQTFSERELINGFMRTVFGSENVWVARRAKNRVSKFSGSVRVQIVNPTNSKLSADVRRFVSDVNRRVPQLAISTTGSASGANYQVFLVRRSEYRAVIRRTLPEIRTAFLERAACSGIAFLRDDGTISRAMAFIVVDEGRRAFRHCMVEEILQGLGPSNDSPRLRHSIFNDRSATDKFTAFDVYLMNMLYDPRIRAGMTRTDVRTLLPSIVRELRQRIG